MEEPDFIGEGLQSSLKGAPRSTYMPALSHVPGKRPVLSIGTVTIMGQPCSQDPAHERDTPPLSHPLGASPPPAAGS